MRKVKFRMGALPKVTQLLKEAMWFHTSSSRLNRPLSLPPSHPRYIAGVTWFQNKLVRVYH